MRVGIFSTQEHAPSSSLAQGIAAAGDSALFQRPTIWVVREAVPFDAVVSHGIKGCELPLTLYRARGTPVLILELPILRCLPDVDNWCSIFWDQIGTYPPSTRVFELRTQELERKSPEPEPLGDEVLILGQCPGDYAHGLTAVQLTAAYHAMIGTIRGRGSAKIRFRPHPDAPMVLDGCDVQSEGSSLEADLRLAGDVYTINSSAGLEALLRGRRVFCDRSASYFRWSGRVVASREERLELLRHVGRVQWSLADLRSGMAWRFYRGLLRRIVPSGAGQKLAVYGNVGSGYHA